MPAARQTCCSEWPSAMWAIASCSPVTSYHHVEASTLEAMLPRTLPKLGLPRGALASPCCHSGPAAWQSLTLWDQSGH